MLLIVYQRSINIQMHFFKCRYLLYAQGGSFVAGWQTNLMFDERKSVQMLQILNNEKIAVDSRHEG
jgi:hypothetical protein